MQFADYKLGQQRYADAGTERNPVQVIAITSGSAGCGKSSIAIGIAQALSSAGRRTLLLDANLDPSGIHKLLGLTPEFSLFDVLSGQRKLDEILLQGPDGVQIVSAASRGRQLAGLGVWECAGLVRAFSDISSPVDTLLIDTAMIDGDCMASLCKAASEIIVVICPDTESMSCAVELIARLQAGYGISRFRVLPNQVASAREASDLFGRMLQRFAANHDVVLSCCGFIPGDECVLRAERAGQPVLSVYPRSRPAMAIRNLASQIMKWPRSAMPGGHLEFFVERLVQNENINKEVRS